MRYRCSEQTSLLSVLPALLLCLFFRPGLQFSRDMTSWLSETHVRYGVGVAADLIKRINELHDLVSMHHGHVCS